MPRAPAGVSWGLGSLYNIPVCIWVLDNHPISPPMVYVKPTPDMLIKASRHVDQNGKVFLPYLHEWNLFK
ncbi:Tumor susceptibility gene 101 protein [Portunus trituberculatus]|uniref:Tumor susceptibility gene 101 protein n=1 Tax=Portunus trituberculatus TaxID=210409 RepID=A0A5B7DGN9_PORTR|nr:Tumor susceptibility gene 101 protein [Portunus trituberculatus]